MSFVLYTVRDNVAIVTLNRPEVGNAQNVALLEELDESFTKAVKDDEVRAIILRAEGKHFSVGHDIAPDTVTQDPWKNIFDDVSNTGLLRLYDWESAHYLGYCKRWRDLPKPTIAAVHGACVAAGLMLCWPMDLIVAADNARFSDPVARMGIGGVEYHGHAWEWGARKAKEMLFTGNWMSVEEAHRLGMVNRIVPLAELDDNVFALAHQIAQMPPHAIRMAKRAVNAALDAQGQQQALDFGYQTHALGHANAWVSHGYPILANLAQMTESNKTPGSPAKS
jgi:enoyl-CoA hydratase